jgi:glycosyltransferase involved in cell wall biosynthesis
MSVVFMLPVWTAPSEVWMQRMLEELSNELSSIICWDTIGEKLWRGRVRAVSLSANTRAFRIVRFLIQNLGIEQKTLEQLIITREIRKHGVKQILCHYGAFATSFMEVWRKNDIPLFVHFHGFDATFDLRCDDQPDKSYFPKSYLTDILELSKYAKFIANSKFTQSLLKEAGIPTEQIAVKYLGVPIPAKVKTHRNGEELKILHLGRLVDFKSPDRTIKAFEMACSKGLNAQLIIAGDGPMRVTCELLKLRSSYGNSIKILGSVNADQAQTLLANADIFTQHNIKGEITRQSECLGVSILEAMAAGLPVVGTKNGGVEEIIIDKETGILIEPGDIVGQANAIYNLAQDCQLRQRFGTAGNKHVTEHFSLEKEYQELHKILKIQ